MTRYSVIFVDNFLRQKYNEYQNIKKSKILKFKTLKII